MQSGSRRALLPLLSKQSNLIPKGPDPLGWGGIGWDGRRVRARGEREGSERGARGEREGSERGARGEREGSERGARGEREGSVEERGIVLRESIEGEEHGDMQFLFKQHFCFIKVDSSVQ